MTHLLDTSALFAFCFDEPGRERIEELFSDPAVTVGLSALTAVEWWARLKAEGCEDAFDGEWQAHLPLFEGIVGCDAPTCRKAVELRAAACSRVPTIDSVIAATAAMKEAILVHRDPHFTAIPETHLQQEVLPSE